MIPNFFELSSLSFASTDIYTFLRIREWTCRTGWLSLPNLSIPSLSGRLTKLHTKFFGQQYRGLLQCLCFGSGTMLDCIMPQASVSGFVFKSGGLVRHKPKTKRF
ncbi:hypothetical protein OIU84_013950 [Salix udensis]|uniref:Uncharacterized protein n=1 Tax=Salix udensis TaxID=889485 RepID=A0AAD6JAU6_9ROSI|nr:hypothetical protein OIU84_013950 [Salix udensis]